MTQLKAVDLFCGIGGGSIGLTNANIEVIGAVDNYDEAVNAYNQHDECPGRAWNKDITQITFDDIAVYFGFEKEDVDIVMGCPPCQNFSKLRDTEAWPEDKPKDELLRTYVERVAEADADIVIFENVPNIFNVDDGRYINWLKRRMNPESREELPAGDVDDEDEVINLNYGMALDIVNAADYGVPQHRKRAVGIFVKGKRNDEVQLPEPTHADPEHAEELGKKPWVSVGEAIGDLEELEKGEKSQTDSAHRARNHRGNTMDIIRAVPKNGGSRTDIEDEDLILDCHKKLDSDTSAGNIYGRMTWEDPAPTLTTRCTSPSCGRYIHPCQDRGITFREAARLQSFPDIELPSKNEHAERVIGNAVPPLLIKTLISGFLEEGIFDDEVRPKVSVTS